MPTTNIPTDANGAPINFGAPNPMPTVQGIDPQAGVTTDGLMDAAKRGGFNNDSMSGYWALRQIFGDIVDNPLSPNPQSQSTVLGAVFYVLNLVLLAIAVLFVSYNFISGAVNTGQDGEFLGKKHSEVWTPVRTLTGFAGMAPVFGGWSIAQLFAIWFAMLGVGAGNIAWNAATDFLAKGGQLIQHTPQVGTSKLAQDLFQMNVCLEGVKASAEDAYNSMGAQYGATQYEARNWTLPAPDASGMVYFGKLGNTDGVCGSVRLPTMATAGASMGGIGSLSGRLDRFWSNATTEQAKQQIKSVMVAETTKNFNTLNVELNRIAKQLVEKSKLVYCDPASPQCQAPAPTPCGATPQGVSTTTFSNACAQGYDIPAIDAAETAYDRANAMAARTAMRDAQQGDNAKRERYDNVNHAVRLRAQEEGFLTAGAYFSSIARTGNALRDAANVGVSVDTHAPIPDDQKIESINERYKLANNIIVGYEKEKTAYKEALNTIAMGGDSKGMAASAIDKVFSKIMGLIATDTFGDNSVCMDAAIGSGACFTMAILPVSNGSADGYDYRSQNILLVMKDAGDYMMLVGAAGTVMTSWAGHKLEGVPAKIAAKMAAVGTGISGGPTGLVAGMLDAATGQTMLETALEEVKGIMIFLFKTMFFFGAMLSIYLPMIPLIHWLGAVISWLAKVVEGVISASLWAFAHLDTDGEGMGQRTQYGYIFMLNLLLTPLLMVIGLLMAIVVMQVTGALFAGLFPIAIADAQANTLMGLISIVGFIAIFCTVSVTIVSNSCDLIHIIPDNALSWIGGHSGQGAGRKTGDGFAAGTGAALALGNQSGIGSGYDKVMGRRHQQKQLEGMGRIEKNQDAMMGGKHGGAHKE